MKYLLKQFPILDSFSYDDVVNDKKVFNEKIESYKNFLGDKIEVVRKSEELSFKNINIWE